MITYEPLWGLMKEKGISTYTLINRYGISAHQLNRWKHGGDMKLSTLNNLCTILDCTPSDILCYVPDELQIVKLQDRNILQVAEKKNVTSVAIENGTPKHHSDSKGNQPFLAKKIKQLLQEQNISPRELALRSGVPLPTIRNIQYGKTKNPRTETLAAIATTLNIPIEDLVER